MNVSAQSHPASPAGGRIDRKTSPATIAVFLVLLCAGLLFSFYSLRSDVIGAGPVDASWLPYLLLGVALLIALGFEFVNGFEAERDQQRHAEQQIGQPA